MFVFPRERERDGGLRDLAKRIGKSRTDDTHNLIIDLNCHVPNKQNVNLSLIEVRFSYGNKSFALT